MNTIVEHDGHALSVTYLNDGKWRLNDKLCYDDEEFGEIIVPSGTVTDLDSIPRLPFAHMLLKNQTVIGATVHDFAYTLGHIEGRQITRKQADEIFLRAMEDEGVSWWARRMIYAGVRLGGYFAWSKHRKRALESA